MIASYGIMKKREHVAGILSSVEYVVYGSIVWRTWVWSWSPHEVLRWLAARGWRTASTLGLMLAHSVPAGRQLLPACKNFASGAADNQIA